MMNSYYMDLTAYGCDPESFYENIAFLAVVHIKVRCFIYCFLSQNNFIVNVKHS